MSGFQEKYASRGFTVVAVNGYDESRDVVAKFVEKEKLKQPILLLGAETASKLYGVSAFPTNYWIDHEGKVVLREQGFDPDLVTVLEDRIERLLAKKAAAAASK